YQIGADRRTVLQKLDPAYEITGLSYCGSSVLVSLVQKGPYSDKAKGRVIAIPPLRRGRLPASHMPSVLLSGRNDICIIKRTELIEDGELVHTDLVFDDQVVPFDTKHVVIDIPHIAAGGCLVRGILYPGDRPGMPKETQVVALAISGPRNCGPAR